MAYNQTRKKQWVQTSSSKQPHGLAGTLTDPTGRICFDYLIESPTIVSYPKRNREGKVFIDHEERRLQMISEAPFLMPEDLQSNTFPYNDLRCRHLMDPFTSIFNLLDNDRTGGFAYGRLATALDNGDFLNELMGPGNMPMRYGGHLTIKYLPC